MTAEVADHAQIALSVVGHQMQLLRASYALGLADIAADEPWAVDKIRNLAQGIRVLDAVEQQLRAAVADEKLDEHKRGYAAQLAGIPSSKRKILGLPL